MKRKIFIALVALITLCSVEKALAWGGLGHSVIAYYAEQLLSPEAKAKCHKYLRSSLAYQASWMDQYRSIEGYTDCDWWHSTNIDAKGKAVEGNTKTGAFHIERIRKDMANGAYKNMPDSLVKINLQYLIHMVGDHHCPVHVRWSKEEHPEFFYNLKRKGKKLSPHRFWDGSPGFARKGWHCEKYYESFSPLSKGKAKKVQKGTGYDWTTETAAASRQCFNLLPEGTDVAKLSKEDIESVHGIVDQQLQRAAYRLAYVIEEIFKY